jgi:hypothetical protein
MSIYKFVILALRLHLHVDVAERTSKGRHHISDLDVLCVDTEREIVVQCSVTACRGVVESNGTSDSVLSVGKVSVKKH